MVFFLPFEIKMINKISGKQRFIEQVIILPRMVIWSTQVDIAKKNIENNEIKKAETKLEYIIEKIPADYIRDALANKKIEAYHILINLYQQQKKYTKVNKLYQELEIFSPKQYLDYYNWSLIKYEQGKYKDVIKLSNKALKIYPDHIQSFQLKIKALDKLEKYDDLIEEYEEFNNRPHAYFNPKEDIRIILIKDLSKIQQIYYDLSYNDELYTYTINQNYLKLGKFINYIIIDTINKSVLIEKIIFYNNKNEQLLKINNASSIITRYIPYSAILPQLTMQDVSYFTITMKSVQPPIEDIDNIINNAYEKTQ